MSSTTSSSAATAAVALLRHRPRQNIYQNNHSFRGLSPNQNPETKPPPPKPITAVASHPPRRREASFALAGLCLASVFDSSFLLLPSPAVAAGAPAETPDCPFTVAPSGLAFCDKAVGSGTEAAKGQLIKAHYVGRLENGKVFDSSYGRGQPLTFRVGVGEVIKGWDQGILGGEGIPPMLAGGKRTLKLPPELGYGARGAGCRGGTCIIPPDSTLLFDVEFIGKA
uniref:peptidylprolyl isomerase n=1 Tax=Cypripedium formosanum TaxID=53042 RepID=A0A0F7GZF0_9ASPA